MLLYVALFSFIISINVMLFWYLIYFLWVFYDYVGKSTTGGPHATVRIHMRTCDTFSLFPQFCSLYRLGAVTM